MVGQWPSEIVPRYGHPARLIETAESGNYRSWTRNFQGRFYVFRTFYSTWQALALALRRSAPRR